MVKTIYIYFYLYIFRWFLWPSSAPRLPWGGRSQPGCLLLHISIYAVQPACSETSGRKLSSCFSRSGSRLNTPGPRHLWCYCLLQQLCFSEGLVCMQSVQVIAAWKYFCVQVFCINSVCPSRLPPNEHRFKGFSSWPIRIHFNLNSILYVTRNFETIRSPPSDTMVPKCPLPSHRFPWGEKKNPPVCKEIL